jgi:succinate-acetate transporter protein
VIIKGRFWIKYEYLYTRSERYYEALDTFSNNILRLIFYKIKNIHTLKIWKCNLHCKEMLAYLSYTLHVD